jgi:CRP/FNR family transcriptional regulator, cyclic AMP receptor protein
MAVAGRREMRPQPAGLTTLVCDDARQRFSAQVAQYLPSGFTDELFNHHDAVAYPKGSILFGQGSPAGLISLLILGVVKIYCPMGNTDRAFVRLAAPGDILGFENFIDSTGQSTRAFEAQALTKCVVALFTREHVAKMLKELDQTTLVRLLEHLNAAWSSVLYRSIVFLGASFRQRLAITFEDLASRFGVKEKRGMLLRIKLSHADLAEMIDGSRTLVTRLIGEMVARQALYRDAGRYIVPGTAVATNLMNVKAAIVQPRTLNRTSNLSMTHPKPANLRQREGRPV